MTSLFFFEEAKTLLDKDELCTKSANSPSQIQQAQIQYIRNKIKILPITQTTARLPRDLYITKTNGALPILQYRFYSTAHQANRRQTRTVHNL
jgi:hypothetical protein